MDLQFWLFSHFYPTFTPSLLMMRTKQTSKKTMGGPAKHSMLLQLKKLTSHAGTKVINPLQSKALPLSGKIVLRPSLHNIGFEDHNGTLVLMVPTTIHGHIEMPRTDEKAEHHAKSMEILVGHLKLLEYEHVEIFVYTHSEIEWGDIWGGFEDDEFVGRRRAKVTIQGKPVTYAVDVFFAGLFVGGIEEYVRGATLWVLICGHMVQQPDSFKLLQTCVKEYEVEHAFTFNAVLFHMCLTIPLVIIYVCCVLVEGFKQPPVLECPALPVFALQVCAFMEAHCL
ncbi:hypothetical protein EDD22DRAFT_850888 [Suillus occidentalis]|nr:hypothetical protein EDD22DRAFT_850888 [Suillus occidentalis]